MPHKKRLSLKSKRTLAARKGARTKRERKQLEHAVHCRRLMLAGMSPQEIAVSEGEPLREVLRLLRLATFIPHPIGKVIGLGATVAEEGLRISEGAFGRDISGASQAFRREIENVRKLPERVDELQKTVNEIGKTIARLRGLP